MSDENYGIVEEWKNGILAFKTENISICFSIN